MKEIIKENICVGLANLIVAIIVGVIAMGSFYAVGYFETHYSMKCKIVNVNNVDNSVVLLDETGNEWEAYAEELEQGDTVKVVFDNNMTESRLDDKVIDIK